MKAKTGKFDRAKALLERLHVPASLPQRFDIVAHSAAELHARPRQLPL